MEWNCSRESVFFLVKYFSARAFSFLPDMGLNLYMSIYIYIFYFFMQTLDDIYIYIDFF